MFLPALLSLLSWVLPLIVADSSAFTLKLSAPGTVLSEANLYVGDDYKFYMANVSDTISGVLKANGSLEIDNPNLVAGIGKNYLSLSADSYSFEIASPFSISGGLLKLYGYNFHAVPSGTDGIYVLGSINAAAGRDTVIVVAIKALNDDYEAVDDYNPAANNGASASAAASSTAITVLDSSQTALISTSTSTPLGGSSTSTSSSSVFSSSSASFTVTDLTSSSNEATTLSSSSKNEANSMTNVGCRGFVAALIFMLF